MLPESVAPPEELHSQAAGQHPLATLLVIRAPAGPPQVETTFLQPLIDSSRGLSPDPRQKLELQPQQQAVATTKFAALSSSLSKSKLQRKGESLYATW